MDEILVKVRLDDQLDERFIPTKAHESDAGFDIKSPFDFVVPAHGCSAFNTLVGMLIPDGYVGMLKSKSGLNVKHGIRSEGVVDAGYTGNIVVKLYNDSDKDYQVQVGDKVTQLVVMPIPRVLTEVVKDFEDTERGDGGFGSTGR